MSSGQIAAVALAVLALAGLDYLIRRHVNSLLRSMRVEIDRLNRECKRRIEASAEKEAEAAQLREKVVSLESGLHSTRQELAATLETLQIEKGLRESAMATAADLAAQLHQARSDGGD